MSDGVKYDQFKRRFSLLPPPALLAIIDILEYGARKYAPGNWANVPDARNRYFDACMRHMWAWRDGETHDLESGLPHLAHAACCIVFLLAKELEAPAPK